MAKIELYEHITRRYADLIKNEVLLKYPNFYFEHGLIMYDYDSERYVYKGYTDEEIAILQEVASSLQHN